MCQQFKVNMRLLKPSLVPIESLSSQIFGQVGIDFMTNLLPSKGFDSIMVVVDHGLSKGVILAKRKASQQNIQRVYLYMDILELITSR